MSEQAKNHPANKLRGEAAMEVDGVMLVFRPSFAALVAAEEELGSLFELIDRAANGRLLLAETVTLLWHLIRDRPDSLDRAAFGDAITRRGMVGVTPVLKLVLREILRGR